MDIYTLTCIYIESGLLCFRLSGGIYLCSQKQLLVLELICHVTHGKLSLLQISQKLYESFIKDVSLFKGCSSGFLQQIVSHLSSNMEARFEFKGYAVYIESLTSMCSKTECWI